MRSYKAIFYECAAVICIALSIIMLLTIHNFRVNHDKERELTQRFFMSEYNEMETKLSVYLNVCQMIADTEEVKNYAGNDSARNYYDYISLISCVKKYRGIFPDADGMITLSRMGDDICVTAGETITLDDYLENAGINSEKLKDMISAGADKEEYFVLMSGAAENDFVTFLYKRRYWSDAEIYFFINVDRNFFCPQQLIKRDMAFLIVEETSGAYTGIQTGFEENPENILPGLSFDRQQMRMEKYRNRSVCHRPSLYAAQMVYVLIDSGSGYAFQIFLLFVLWAVLILLGLVVAHKITKELQGSMNRLLKLLKGDPRTDKWDFIMKSVQEMIDKNRDLSYALKETNAQRKKVFLREMLTGSLTDNEIRTGLNEFEIEPSGGEWRCILFEYDSGELKPEIRTSENKDMLKNDFSETACKYLEDNLNGILVRLDRNRFACMVAGCDVAALNAQLVRLLDMGDELYNAQGIIAIGESTDNICHINASYISAMCLLEQRYWNEDKLIFNPGDLQNGNSSFYYPIDLEKLLITVVLDGDKEKCDEILKRLMKTNLLEFCLDRYNMTEFRFSLTSTVKRIFKQMNKTVEDVFGKDMIVYLELNAATPREFENTVYRIFDRLCECNSIHTNQQQMNMISKIVNFIHENYFWDISLNDLAEYCSVSQGHINRLLRGNLNISFKEYLDKYRVKTAQELFQTTGLTVNEVSAKVGYNYTKSFISAFKKYAFMTPGEYKYKYKYGNLKEEH